jgi:hypothetical protein
MGLARGFLLVALQMKLHVLVVSGVLGGKQHL